MVINSLERRDYKEHHSLTCSHTRQLVAKTSTKSVEEESFEGMVVQGTKGVRDIKTVVAGME